MKRNGIVLLALAALLLTLLALTGAVADTETCRHNWVKVGDAPTCTQTAGRNTSVPSAMPHGVTG